MVTIRMLDYLNVLLLDSLTTFKSFMSMELVSDILLVLMTVFNYLCNLI